MTPEANYLNVRRVLPEALLPTRAYPSDAGLDLYAAESVNVGVNQTHLIETGIAVEIPEGYVGLILDRSSMASRGASVRGGVIDSSYRGTVKVCIVADAYPSCDKEGNYKEGLYQIRQGDRIAQLLIIPVALPIVLETSELSPSPRGEGGFGSTGV